MIHEVLSRYDRGKIPQKITNRKPIGIDSTAIGFPPEKISTPRGSNIANAKKPIINRSELKKVKKILTHHKNRLLTIQSICVALKASVNNPAEELPKNVPLNSSSIFKEVTILTITKIIVPMKNRASAIK